MRQVFFIFFIAGIFLTQQVHAQHSDSLLIQQPSDSILQKRDSVYGNNLSKAARDSIEKKKFNPRKATLYSAILPGAGQVYNKKYWKVPIIYVALGLSGYAYFYNKSWYQKCQYALNVTYNIQTNGSVSIDSLKKVDPSLMPFVTTGDTNGLITNRDAFRKYEDYAVLYFLLFYGLNILDATVDAHLRDFNVTSDLSFKIKPMFIPGPTVIAGVTLAFNIHKPRFLGLALN